MQTEIAKVATACRLPGFRYVVFAPPSFSSVPFASAEAVAAPAPPPVAEAPRAPLPAATEGAAVEAAAPLVPVDGDAPAAPRPRILAEVFPVPDGGARPHRPSGPIWPAPRARPRPASPGRESGLVRPPRASARYTLLDEVTGAAMDEAEEAPPDRRRSASALLAALRRRTPH